ncbi:MAG: DUF11 domain-containing protein [Anaerolineae bacterium]|nr:DUF11 domain-containing protein [Anaerolineae bacterium]
MQRSINVQARSRRGWLALLFCLGTFVIAWAGVIEQAGAEGSRDLYPAGASGNRANIEWRNSFYGSFLRRRSLFQVYAEAGEVMLLGSSAVGVQQGDIWVYNPNRIIGITGDEDIPDNPNFSCDTQRSNTGNINQGRITNRTMELAGPDTIADPATATPGNAIPNGYVPCFYTAPESGIYYVIFLGPAGNNSDAEIAPPGEVDLSSPENFNEQQGTSVAAWDVTIRSDLTSTTDINGRLYVNYLTRFTGGWPRPSGSSYFISTDDGYLYRTDMRGIDANGFIVYANDIGFLDSNGAPLYHDVMSDPSATTQEQNQLQVLLGGVSLAPPSHLIFFNPPSQEALLANNFPTSPIIPQIVALQFEGRLVDNDSFVGGGGVFTSTSNTAGVLELIISRDGVDFSPDNPLNRVLREVNSVGLNTMIWDGLDNNGDPFPVGEDYQARMINRGGEHHFPMLDIESSLEGGPTFTLLNPPNGNCPSFEGQPPNCNIAFYDDRGYTTANGTDVGTPGQVLPNNIPPDPPNSDLLAGFDTTTNQRQFGDGSISGFGDAKGLDLWTFYPSQPQFVTIDILALNVAIDKTDNGMSTFPGGTIPYTLRYTNTYQIDALGTVITETVPLYTTFNAAASAPTLWNCPDGSPAGTICTTSLGLLPSGATGTVTFGVTVLDTIPDTVTQIDNIAVIGEDGSRGPEPKIDNQDTETTPLELVPPTFTATPTTTSETPTFTPTPTTTSGTQTPTATFETPTTPTPSMVPTDETDDDDDDDGSQRRTSTPDRTTSSNGTPVAELIPSATPTLPVLFLPNTGDVETRPASLPYGLILSIVLGMSMSFIWWMQQKKS